MLVPPGSSVKPASAKTVLPHQWSSQGNIGLARSQGAGCKDAPSHVHEIDGESLQAGYGKELSQEETDENRGLVNYNNHFEVLKEGYSSTRLKIVSNLAVSPSMTV